MFTCASLGRFQMIMSISTETIGGKLHDLSDLSLTDIRLVSLVRVQANIYIYRKMNSLKFLIWFSKACCIRMYVRQIKGLG